MRGADRGGRGRLLDEGPGARRHHRGAARCGARAAMKLSAANTAIVLDSTADFTEERGASRTGGSYRSTCASGTRAFATTSISAPTSSMSGCARRPSRRRPRSRRRATSSRAYEGLGEHYDRILSLHIAANLSGTFESARRPRELLGGGGARDRHRDASRRPGDARTRRSSVGSTAARPTRRSTRSSRASSRARPALHRRHARVPAARRPHRQGGAMAGRC